MLLKLRGMIKDFVNAPKVLHGINLPENAYAKKVASELLAKAV